MQLPPLSTPFAAVHPAMGEVRATADYLPDHPDDQVSETVSRMTAFAHTDATDPAVQRIASGLSGNGTYPQGQTIENIWHHAKSSIQFELDQDTARAAGLPQCDDVAEVLVRPADMARLVTERGRGVGDCDDFTMYVCALCIASGVPCGIVTVGAKDSPYPEQFSHVYGVAYVRSADGATVRVPIDASHGPRCGWEAPDDVLTRKQEYAVSGGGDASGPDSLHVLGKFALLGLGSWLVWSHYGPMLRTWWTRQRYLSGVSA